MSHSNCCSDEVDDSSETGDTCEKCYGFSVIKSSHVCIEKVESE